MKILKTIKHNSAIQVKNNFSDYRVGNTAMSNLSIIYSSEEEPLLNKCQFKILKILYRPQAR